MRVVHFYTMKDEPERVRKVAPKHSAYWRRAGVGGYQGGPFEDRSGGLITFEVDSRKHAEHLIQADPFVREELLESSWIKQWMIDA
jgi:uncharacterized protein YciI